MKLPYVFFVVSTIFFKTVEAKRRHGPCKKDFDGFYIAFLEAFRRETERHRWS